MDHDSMIKIALNFFLKCQKMTTNSAISVTVDSVLENPPSSRMVVVHSGRPAILRIGGSGRLRPRHTNIHTYIHTWKFSIVLVEEGVDDSILDIHTYIHGSFLLFLWRREWMIPSSTYIHTYIHGKFPIVFVVYEFDKAPR
jgi:hypothetical protein